MTTTDSMKVWLDGITLQVADVERSLKFYQHFPGAILEHHRPKEFALLRLGQATRLGLLGFGAPSFHLEISTNDIDKVHLQLRAGIKPAGPPQDPHWGERTFDVIDPDGNRIEFAGG